MLISNEKTARELLKAGTIIQGMHSFEIDDMLKNQKSVSVSPRIMAYKMVNIIEGEGISATLPALGLGLVNGNKTTELMGNALFKADKLIGFLDKKESKYFCFVTDKVNKGLLIERESPENQMSDITLEIFKSKTKVKPKVLNGKLLMEIHVECEVAIAEMGTSVDYINEKGRSELKKDSEEELKNSIEKVIKKVQSEYDSDIFGFGRRVKADMPSLWKKIRSDWDEMFSNLEVNVSVEIAIRNSGLNSKPIKVGG